MTHFHFPAAFCCGCNLKFIDYEYNVAMTFILLLLLLLLIIITFDALLFYSFNTHSGFNILPGMQRTLVFENYAVSVGYG